MYDLLSKLDSGELLGLCGIIVGMIAILGGITVATTKVIASYYRRVQLDEMESTLKMEMIQRGMTAADIKTVLEARSGSSRGAINEILAEWSGLAAKRRPGPFAKECNKT